MKKIIIILISAILLFACGKRINPKPYGYFRIDLPTPEYLRAEQDEYSFEMSKYARFSPYDGETEGINIDYNFLNGRIHLSYMPLDIDTFSVVSEECRTLAYKHTIKANAIIENYYENDSTKVYGVLYKITGNAASPVQFFLTDSTKHFLRGALYFNNLPNYDSIAPVADYVNQDIIHLIETLRWK